MSSLDTTHKCSSEVCSYIKYAHETLTEIGKPLDFLNGLNIWLSSSKNEELPFLVKTIYECTLSALGVSFINCEVEDIISNKYDYDALIMFPLTPGVSARAIELIVTSQYDKDVKTEKLYIYMSKEHQNKGYIDKRLNESDRIGKIQYYNPEQCLEKEVFQNIIRNLINLAKRKKNRVQLKESEFIPEVLLVTALEVEYIAMKEMLSDAKPDKNFGDDQKQYTQGKIGNKNVLVILSGVGNNLSAVYATKALQRYESTIKYTIMVGIAAGVPYLNNPEQHIRLGDIVVSGDDGVIQYDKGKKVVSYLFPKLKWFKKETFVHNHQPRPPEAILLRNSKSLIAAKGTKEFDFWNKLDSLNIQRQDEMSFSKTDWLGEKEIEKHPIPEGYNSERPRVHIGTIGSANTVIKNQVVRDELKKEFNLLAIEMESSGISDATWSIGKDYFVVRGICDYANNAKNDIWHTYSAYAAATFTKELIEYINEDI